MNEIETSVSFPLCLRPFSFFEERAFVPKWRTSLSSERYVIVVLVSQHLVRFLEFCDHSGTQVWSRRIPPNRGESIGVVMIPRLLRQS